MNRFIVVYWQQEAYRHIHCQTRQEANEWLEAVFIREGGKPMGIYDAKTELFHWEPARQQVYDQLGIDEQGRLGHHIIAIAQAFFSQLSPVTAVQLHT